MELEAKNLPHLELVEKCLHVLSMLLCVTQSTQIAFPINGIKAYVHDPYFGLFTKLNV
jgi:hypothetical protein